MQPALDGWKNSLRGEASASALALRQMAKYAVVKDADRSIGAVSLDTFKQGFRETASANGTAERREFGANGP